MKAKLIVEGKEFEIEIVDQELPKLIVLSKNKTGYERVDAGEDYYYSAEDGTADCDTDHRNSYDDDTYAFANYYSDKTVASNNARADKLMRQLRRFAVEHREQKLSWTPCNFKYLIMYKPTSGELTCVAQDVCKVFGVIYFDTQETANLAIDTFHDELIWYFTEYKDSL